MSHLVNNPKTPTLRFPEFSGEWEQKRLGEIVRISKGSGISKSDITSEGQYPCIRYGELYTKYSEVITEVFSKTNLKHKSSVISGENDLLIPSSGETALDIARTSHVVPKSVLLGGDMTILSLEEKDSGVFFAYYLSNGKKTEIAKLAQGNSVVHIYGSHLKTIEINRPSFEEQQKIASFLTTVDDWIENLKKQKEAQEKYKKGMMQKIFSQEIRFRNENRENYPEWEEKRLGDYFNITSSKRVFQSEWRNEGVPFYRAREIVKLAENGFVNNTLYISEPMFREYKKKYGAPKPGDLLITGVGTLGRVYLVKDNSPIYFKDGNIIWLRTLHTINSFFVTTLFELREVRKQIIDNASLSTVGTFTIDTAKKLKVSVPCKEEQQKIADFLSSIDDLIILSNQRITLAEEWKKGLMQRMFV